MVKYSDSYDAKAYTLNFICSETDNYTLSSDGFILFIGFLLHNLVFLFRF